MKTRTTCKILSTALLLLFLIVTAGPCLAASRRGADVQIYSLQILVSQAYQMALEGANLVMLDQMGKGGIFGGVLEKRGWAMIDQAERIITETLNGQEMEQMVREGYQDNPLLLSVKENTVQLGKAVSQIRNYLGRRIEEPHLSQMHSIYTLLNHGIKMALDGSKMIMLGRVSEAGGAKDTLQKHGRSMMQDGRVFIVRLSENETMKSLIQEGFTIEKDPGMAAIHEAIALSLRIIDRLARM